jgi:hypothetical protein
MDGVAFAKGATRSDIATLQVGYIAESLAVKVYETILANFSRFKLHNQDYFQKALGNEKAHRAAWAKALGPKPRPASGFTSRRPRWPAGTPCWAPASPWSAAAATLTKDGFIS